MARFTLTIQRWRTITTALVLTTVFQQGASQQTQVDTTKALIWSSRRVSGAPVLNFRYGDPQIYVPESMNSSRNANSSYSYYSTAIVSNSVNLEFGVLDTGYAESIVYFYSTMNIFESSNFIPQSSTEYYYIPAVALSNQITGISYDWVSKIVYWSDAIYQRICMVDAPNYGYWRSVVDVNITSPQDVVVYPQQSYLFWSDVGLNPKIERLNLKTDERQILLSNGTLLRPKTLAIDFANQRLFWLDTGSATVGSINLDGSGISLWTLSLFSSISSFVLYQNYIFVGNNISPTIYIYSISQRQYLSNITTASQQGIIDMTMWSPERQTDVDSLCSFANGGCDHFCITVSTTSRRCLCAMGFLLAQNGVNCVTKPLQVSKFLLMMDRSQMNIFQIDVNTGEVRALTVNNGFLVPTAMTFDPTHSCLYWFDSNQDIIYKTAFDNSYNTILINVSGSEITSLAIDTATNTLFYTDQMAQTITQVTLSNLRTSVFLSEAVSNPRTIVLDTHNRLIYWSDCGTNSIQRASITDSSVNRKSVLSGLTSCITAFAIDFLSGVIYWGDKSGTIGAQHLDGSNLRPVISQDPNAAYTGMALDDRFIYIADSNKRQIQKLDRTTNQITNLTRILFTQPYALLYYPGQNQNSTPTTRTPTTTTTDVTSSTTIILASVISGAVVLIAIIVVVGVVIAKKYRNRRTENARPVSSVYDIINYNGMSAEPVILRREQSASPYNKHFNESLTSGTGGNINTSVMAGGALKSEDVQPPPYSGRSEDEGVYI